MKKLLFINACVRADSRTKRLCDAFLAPLEGRYEITERRLDSIGLKALDGESLFKRDELIRKARFDAPEFYEARLFADADLVVVGAPYWDLSFPALLKVYIENIMVLGVTFIYGERGQVIPLGRAGRMFYISTAGGYIGEKDSGERYMRDVCDMLGISELRTIKAEGLDIFGNDPEAILAPKISEARAMAEIMG